MNKEEYVTIELTNEEGTNIVWCDHEDYKLVEELITGQSRWTVECSAIYHRPSDDTYWQMDFDRPATECQDDMGYFDRVGKPILTQVEEKEVTIIKYVPVRKNV